MKHMVNVIMKHHKQVYPYYLSNRSLLCLMRKNVKLLLEPFIAGLIFIYNSEKEKFSLWQNWDIDFKELGILEEILVRDKLCWN